MWDASASDIFRVFIAGMITGSIGMSFRYMWKYALSRKHKKFIADVVWFILSDLAFVLITRGFTREMGFAVGIVLILNICTHTIALILESKRRRMKGDR